MHENKFQENAGIYCHEVAAPPPQVDSGAAAAPNADRWWALAGVAAAFWAVNPGCKPSKSSPCQLNRGAAPSMPKGEAAAAAKNGLAAAAASPGWPIMAAAAAAAAAKHRKIKISQKFRRCPRWAAWQKGQAAAIGPALDLQSDLTAAGEEKVQV